MKNCITAYSPLDLYQEGVDMAPPVNEIMEKYEPLIFAMHLEGIIS